jgi:hypothetical protein
MNKKRKKRNQKKDLKFHSKKKQKTMETTEKTSKKEKPLKALKEEMERRFKKDCDACKKTHDEQLKFKESQHAKEYAKLLSQRDGDLKLYDQKVSDYRKELSLRWMKSKLFWRCFIPAVCIAISSICINVNMYKSHKKMKIYNTALKYLQDANPKIDYGRLVRVIERPEIEPEWHKEIKEITNKYEDLWWLK